MDRDVLRAAELGAIRPIDDPSPLPLPIPWKRRRRLLAPEALLVALCCVLACLALLGLAVGR